jgi:LytS/YehU family sensor histidine kinase
MIVVDLIYNLSILIAISILAGFFNKRWNSKTFKGQILQGLLFGITAIIGMMQPFVMSEGIIFDGRSVILSLCALFFGPVSGIIAAFLAAIYRIYLGGGGAVMGVSVITASTIIGLIYYHLRKTKSVPINSLNLLILGLAVHLVMILLMFTLPSKMQFITLKIISLTVIIAYPLATVLIGKILKDQEDNQRMINEIKESEYKYRLLVENQSD